MRPHRLAAIDQGTTGTTVLVVDERDRVVGRAYREIPQSYPRPGWVEHDPQDVPGLGAVADRPHHARGLRVRSGPATALDVDDHAVRMIEHEELVRDGRREVEYDSRALGSGPEAECLHVGRARGADAHRQDQRAEPCYRSHPIGPAVMRRGITLR